MALNLASHFGEVTPQRARRIARVRGTTSIEMLICFLILVTAWFGLAQLSLIGVARLVVQHAAHRTARAAIVILDDDPKEYDNAPRGLVAREGEPRMAAIRKAAYAPLAVLAPHLLDVAKMNLAGTGTVEAALRSDVTSEGSGALYNPIGAAVTLERDDAPAESFAGNQPVKAHIAYLFHCRVPLAARLICKLLPELTSDKETAKKLEYVEQPDAQDLLKASGQYFLLLEGQETLPNQAANYHTEETSSGESGTPPPTPPAGDEP